MSDPRNDQWAANKAVAQGMLHSRVARRKFMSNCAFLLLAVFAVGRWVIDKWLLQHPWGFLLWWGGCLLLTVFIILLALYDIARVLREERDKTR
jgi:hypothetical protein